MKKEEVLEIRIEMTINMQTALFIVLGKDGSLARQGNGNREILKERYLSESDESLFIKLMETIEEDLFDHFGVYDMPEKDGDPCRLSVVFKNEKEVKGFEFYYGYKSKHGPHVDVLKLVEEAVNLTEGWYQEVRKGKGRKWWHLFSH
jgi:hypothetical protein